MRPDPTLLPAAVAAASGAIVSLSGAALTRRLALRRGWVSRASSARGGPGGVPLLGGVAALCGLACGVAAGGALGGAAALPAALVWPALVLAIGFGAVGLSDERRGWAPVPRLLVESIVTAGALSLAIGLTGTGLAPPAAPVLALLGPLALIVAAGNAGNLIDNADGLAAGVMLLSFLGLAAVTSGAPAMIAAAAGGALLGILWWNRPPARIYLGDSGSLSLGALLGFLICRALWRDLQAGAGLVAEPRGPQGLAYILICGYLIVDPAYAVLGRIARGRVPWVGGVDHPSHHLSLLHPRWSRAWVRILALQAFSVATGCLILLKALPPAAGFAALVPWAALAMTARRAARRGIPATCLAASLAAGAFWGCAECPTPPLRASEFTVARDLTAEIATWRGGCTAALTFAFDDTRDCSHEIIAPALEVHGFRGTFNINTAAVGQAWAPWIDLAARGHELGNHTRHHRVLTTLSLDEAREEIEQGRRDLLEGIPTLADVATFTYPEGASNPGVRAIALEQHVSARGAWGWNSSSPEDYSRIKGRAFDDFAQIMRDVDETAGSGRWLVAYFHAVGGEDLPAEDFARYLDHVAARRDSLWIAPQGEIAKYARERDACRVRLSGANPGVVSLETDLDPGRFNVPLAVRLTVAQEGIDAIIAGGHVLFPDERRQVWIELAPGDSLTLRLRSDGKQAAGR